MLWGIARRAKLGIGSVVDTWHWKCGGRVVVATCGVFLFKLRVCMYFSHYCEGYAGGGLHVRVPA